MNKEIFKSLVINSLFMRICEVLHIYILVSILLENFGLKGKLLIASFVAICIGKYHEKKLIGKGIIVELGDSGDSK